MVQIIGAENLEKQYGSIEAVAGINFSIEKGDFFGFLGPNGAGKSTILRMINCVSPITSGRLTIDGKLAYLDNRNIKSVLGVVSQEDNLDTDLSVLQNLLVYSRYYDVPKAQALNKSLEMLDFFTLFRGREVLLIVYLAG